jgi:hypothetical protein
MRASDNSIGCCPWGQTCTSTPAPAAGGGEGAWQSQPQQSQPTPQASTIYVTQTHATTVIYAAGGQQQQQATTVYPGLIGQGQGQGQPAQYCSTLYAHGANLPTTEAGTCRTILIANTAEKSNLVTGWWIMISVLLTVMVVVV